MWPETNIRKHADGYLESNLLALMRRDPKLAYRLVNLRPSLNWKIHLAADGHKTAEQFSGNGCSRFLHSRISPMKSAETWANSIRNTSETLVVLGVGLGYHLLALEIFDLPNALVIIDADVDLFGLAVRLTDLTSLLNNPRVHLLIGKTILEVNAVLKNLGKGSITYREHLAATSLYPEYYQSIKDGLERLVFKYRLSASPEFGQGVIRLLDETKR